MAVPNVYEKAMRPAVDRFLAARGLTVFHEVVLGWQADVVGIRLRKNGAIETLVAVEMKLADVNRALDQACVYKVHAHEAWVCMPVERADTMKAAQFQCFHNEGIGLLLWEPSEDGQTYGGKCRKAIGAARQVGPERSLEAKLLRRVRRSRKRVPTKSEVAWKKGRNDRAREYRRAQRERLKALRSEGKAAR